MAQISPRLGQLALFLALGCGGIAMAGPLPTIDLARGGKALLSVTVGPRASDAVKSAAADLAAMLSRLGGATFQVVTGAADAGIVVGRPADFDRLPFAVAFEPGPFAREAYLLRSTDRGVYLLGASDLAVTDAVWDLLYRLGYRQFFPGAKWEVIPPPSDLSVSIAERCQPAFLARRIWYNWGLWGYNNEPYRQWCTRNRAVRGFELNSGHAYQEIFTSERAAFQQHPQYLALVGGERRDRGGDTKFCVANPGLRQLVVDWAVRRVKQQPDVDSISLEPSDGDGWCECADCKALGETSDRVVMLANAVAKAINQLGLGEKYVGIYAYNLHTTPPKATVDPHVLVSATTAFITGGLTFDQVVAGWQARGATMGVYDYLSVVDWDWNLPRGGAGGHPRRLAASLKHFHELGARFYDAEAGDCWGPCGLGYYVASRVLWDLRECERVDALMADFVDRAFPGAQAPMREFYRLLNDEEERRPPADLVGRLYRQLDQARRAVTDPAVLARLDDLILYVRHAELYYAHANGGGTVEAVARHDYRMRDTMMVHSYGLWCRLVSQEAALDKQHPWKSEEPFSRAELDRILADGIAANRLADQGFQTTAYSRRLVPANPRLRLPSAQPGQFPPEGQERAHYWAWLPDDHLQLDVKVRVHKVWRTREPSMSLFSVLDDAHPVATDTSYVPDDQEHAVTLKSRHAGLHRLDTVDGGDYTQVTFAPGQPVSLESGVDTADLACQFRGAWTLCFYVPRGTKVVGGWAARVANWAPRISGKLLDGDGREVFDFAGAEDGWFRVAVPPGQDGRVWRFVANQGMRQLMTVPPYLARSADELLLPEEVVAADAQR